MARTFTKIGKEITIAVKAGGADETGNPRLRALIKTARAENMPKDNIERAIKRAFDKNQGEYKEVIFEGFGPHGVAFLIETATDNNTRTVANVRSYFTKTGGTLQTSGSTQFMFDHKSVFKIKAKDGMDLEELELELIDYGVDEIFEEIDEETEARSIVLYGDFTSFNDIQKYIEDNGYEIESAAFEWIPNVDLKEIPEDQRGELNKLIEKLEEDDDVQNVFHTMAP